ncbi:AAA domain protein [Fusobacterium sp. OBRC1]|nr:AAA domain protein [Fusobacterium sp. OBRC1]
MLKLIMEELKQNGIDEKQFININFENLINKELTASDKLHNYILKKASEIKKKCYIFLDEIQEVKE